MNPNLIAYSIHERAKKYGERAAYRYRNQETGQWTSVSWTRFSSLIKTTSKALAKIGVKEQDNVSIFSQNMPEIFIVDYGLFSNRAVSVPMYATSSKSQVEYIVKDAEVSLLFVGEQTQYDIAREVMASCDVLKQLIVFDPAVKLDEADTTTIFFDAFLKLGELADNEALVNSRLDAAVEEDLSLILYTSGTTGEPKGVMLPHSCFVAQMKVHDAVLTKMTDKDVSMAFLPMSHIFEKTWIFYCFHKGVEVAVNLRPTEIQTTIKEVRPTLMCCVPRFWEKVYAGVQEKIASTQGFAKTMMLAAIEVGKERNLNYVRLGKKAPFLLELKYSFFDKVIFSKLRRAIGVDNANFFPTAGAMLSDKLNRFFHTCGIDICYGYGLTESTATVCCFKSVGYEFGTIGSIVPGLEVKIDPANNEILLRGDTIMKGYYKKPEATREAFTEDGWFRTGDAGAIHESGALMITERIKELYKTVNGKYIAPQAVEAKLGEDTMIEQIMVIGDQRKYVTALIVPAYAALEEYAKKNGINFNSRPALLADKKIITMIQERIDAMQDQFSPYERVKKFRLLSKPFTMETGELTNTLKLKRRVINERYADIIETLYMD